MGKGSYRTGWVKTHYKRLVIGLFDAYFFRSFLFLGLLYPAELPIMAQNECSPIVGFVDLKMAR
ncbi:MAG: hypothetical protein C0402_11215 [Thermodesulfovibrio sp.]|nr:hypothetical protein [Thermodesulfovibrio sp.]